MKLTAVHKRLYFLTILLSVLIDNITAQELCESIIKIQDYQNSVKLDHGSSGIKIDTSTFNLEQYLDYFKEIKFPENKKCYLYYSYGGLDGHPYFYVADNGFNLVDYLNQKVPVKWWQSNYRRDYLLSREKYLFLLDSTNQARFNIIPNESEKGYIQYLFFKEFGDQFALYWHSNYDEKYVICKTEQIVILIDDYSNSELFSADKNELNNLKNINADIKIEMANNSVVITWIECWIYWGIYKKEYTIARKYPYNINLTRSDTLAWFNPNFLY